MTDSTELFQRAVSFDWEALLPIIFFVLYGLAQFLGSRKSKSGESEEAGEGDADPMDRARRIREEIRRKIEERAQAAESGKPEAPTARSRERPAYDPTLPEHQQQHRNLQPSQPRQARTTPDPAPRQRPPVQEARPVMASQGSDIEERLRRQRERLAEARKRQEEARSEARRIEKRAGVHRRRSLLEESSASRDVDLVSLKTFRNQVISGLRQPNTIRKAVLYREILDPPLGLR